jgi:serine protease
VRKSFISLNQARQVLAGPRADQEAFILFQDSLPDADRNLSLGVRVRLRGLSWATAPRRNFVLLEYTLKNVGPDPLSPLLAGLFMDWDLPGEPGRNAAVWDAGRQMGYCYDVGAPRQYAGVRLLRGGEPLTYAINNGAPAGTPVYFRDGFSRAEKYLTLNSGTATPTAGLPTGADVSQVVGANVGTVAAGDSALVVFAVLAAGSLAELQAAADAAQVAYTQVLPVRATTATAGWHLFPNPTTGLIHLEVPAAFGAADVQVTDALGRLVLRRPVTGPAFNLSLQKLTPGVYTVRVTSRSGRMLSRLVLVQ